MDSDEKSEKVIRFIKSLYEQFWFFGGPTTTSGSISCGIIHKRKPTNYIKAWFEFTSQIQHNNSSIDRI